LGELRDLAELLES